MLSNGISESNIKGIHQKTKKGLESLVELKGRLDMKVDGCATFLHIQPNNNLKFASTSLLTLKWQLDGKPVIPLFFFLS